MLRKFALALSTTCLIPFAVLAEEDEFGIGDAPVEKPAPVYFNQIELGIGHSSDDPVTAGRYSGRNEDGLLPVGSLSYLYRDDWTSGGADFLRLGAEGFGYDSRRLAIEGGEQGKLKLSFNYDLLPFNDTQGITPFTGEGGSKLSLVPGWTKPANAAALGAPNAARMRAVDIKSERERFGSGITWQIDPQWSLRMAARQERKEGLRQIGALGTVAMVVPEPVDYQDDRVETEVGFVGKRVQWRAGYNLSLFRNENESLTIDNAFDSATRPSLRMGLPPDNSAHSFFTDGGLQLSDTTRLTTNLSYSEYLQDDTFLPYGINTTSQPMPLPRSSLDGRIATTTANLELHTRPADRIDWKSRYRFTDRTNDTPVSEYVYIQADDTTQQTASSSRYRRNTPFSYQEHVVSQDVGYSVTPRTKLTGGYEFRDFQRSHSERAKNVDNTGYLQLRSALGAGVTGNAKYARTWRDGSTYSPQGSLVNTNNSAYIAANPYDNHPLLRKFYQADLIRDRVQTGVTFAPTEALSLGASGGLSVDEYVRSELGLTDAVATTATLDASYQASPDLTLTGFYTYERRTTDQAGWSSLTDNSQRWWITIAEDAHTVGIGSQWQMAERWKMLFDYAFVWTVTEVDPTKNGSAALPAAASFPDVTARIHNIALRTEYDLTDSVVLGLGYALEVYRSKDWAYDDLNANSTSVLTLGETSADFDAHLVMVTTRYKF